MEEIKKFLTYKNSRTIILVCCAISLVLFFLPVISVMGKMNVSMVKCLFDAPFGDSWWTLLFLICPIVGGYLAYKDKVIKPIAGYCLAGPIVAFLLFSPMGVSFAGLGFIYFLAAAVAIASGVGIVATIKKREE